MISYILFYSQVVSSMNSQYSCERMMNSDSSDIALMNLSCHMEVSTITANNSWLSTFSKLCISNLSDQTIGLSSCQHQMRTVFLFLRILIALNFNISRNQSDLCSHHKIFAAICLDSCIVLMFELLYDGYCCATDRLNCHLLCFLMIKSACCNSNLLTRLPINRMQYSHTCITDIHSTC